MVKSACCCLRDHLRGSYHRCRCRRRRHRHRTRCSGHLHRRLSCCGLRCSRSAIADVLGPPLKPVVHFSTKFDDDSNNKSSNNDNNK